MHTRPRGGVPPQPPAAGYGLAGGYADPRYGTPNAYSPTFAPPIGVWRSPVDDRPAVTGMGGAIRAVFTKYVGFEGRASRPEFWYWMLFYGIVLVGCYALLIIGMLGSYGPGYAPGFGMSAIAGLFGLLLWLWLLASFLPTLAVQIRRLRDAGFHWAVIFLNLVPFGGIAVLVMCAMPSKYP